MFQSVELGRKLAKITSASLTPGGVTETKTARMDQMSRIARLRLPHNVKLISSSVTCLSLTWIVSTWAGNVTERTIARIRVMKLTVPRQLASLMRNSATKTTVSRRLTFVMVTSIVKMGLMRQTVTLQVIIRHLLYTYIFDNLILNEIAFICR